MAPILQTFDRVEPFTVSIPANTPKVTPIERSVTFRPGKVVHLEVLVPPGHNGLTGFSIAQAHQPVFPDRANTFIVSSNERFDWDVQEDAANGDWQLFGYNTGAVPHSFYLRFYVVELSSIGAGLAPIMQPLTL